MIYDHHFVSRNETLRLVMAFGPWWLSVREERLEVSWTVTIRSADWSGHAHIRQYQEQTNS